jgi:anti-anti-sigma factor
MSRAARSACSSRVLISIRGSVAIAYCVGTLDRSQVDDLCDRVLGLAAQGVRGFVCSLERVSHIHFQALDPLLKLQKSIAAHGGRIVLTDASPYLRQILDFGGIPRQVSMATDKHQAVGKLLQAAETISAHQSAS